MAEINKDSISGGRGSGGRGGGGRGPRRGKGPPEVAELLIDGKPAAEVSEKVVFINRNSKVVKGGRRFSFSALVVVGDKQGSVGIGLGKSSEVADAIRKGGEFARSNMVKIAIRDNTIPHEIQSHYCGAHILLRPASPGTGVIAGKTVRALLESVGIKDVLSKSLGSSNPANVVKATLTGLQRLRLREEIYRGRGLSLKRPEKIEKTEETAATTA